MKKLTAFCFSGTGNTRYIVEYLCGKLSGEYDCEICSLPFHGDAGRAIAASDVLLFAFPIYGSEPPIPMRQFVHVCGERLRGKKVAIVETQYFYSCDGAAGIGRTVRKYGGKVLWAEMFNMPNNLSDCKAFPIKNGEEIAPVLEKARRRADRFAAKIVGGKMCLRGFSPVSHALGYCSQRMFWRKGEAAKRSRLKIDKTRCVRCGLCVRQCPVNNLRRADDAIQPLGRCVLCYRCVNLCPKQAITLIGSAPPTVQYRGPK